MKRRIFALRGDDIQRLFKVADVEKMKPHTTGPRNRLIIRVLVVTGLRVSELAALRVEDVDLREGLIYVWSGKGRKQRTVLADAETLRILAERCHGRDSKDSLIGLQKRQIQNIVKRYARAAGVKWAEHVSPHRLRDTFAVEWIRGGGDLESLRRLLGHTSLAVTQKYLVFSFDEVRAAYDRVWGKKRERRLYE